MIKKLLALLTGAAFRLSIGGGGGGQQQQQPTTQTVQQTNLPAWAQPYSEQLLGKAQALTDVNQNPYQAYSGQRLAGFTPMQQQAFGNIAGMGVSPQIGVGTGLAGVAGLGGLGAQGQYEAQATSPGAMAAYMSPYMQNVVDWQKQQAIMDYGRALPGLGAQAAQQGAFGGSRQALVQSEAQRNLQNQLAGIGATGAQNAWQQAQQAQQFGAGLGMQGLGLAGQAAQTLGQLGQQQYGQQMGINAAQQQAGAQQQAMEQQGLTNQYQDYLNRQNYPYQQLAFMSDILHGTPTGGITTAQTYQAAPSMFSQIAGLGMGLGALGKGFGVFKEGSEVKGYAKGGEVEHYDDGGLAGIPGVNVNLADPTTELGVRSQLGRAQQGKPTVIPIQTLIELKDDLDKLKQPQASPQQTTVAQDLAKQVLGLPALPAPILDRMGDETVHAAGGGIVAFADGGDTMTPETAAYQKAMSDTWLSKGLGRLGAGIADVVSLPGQLGWDWEHYNRTGELKKKYETQGLFPISSAQPERESGAGSYFGAARDAARQRQAQQAVPTQPTAPTGIASTLPTAADYEDAAAGQYRLPATQAPPQIKPPVAAPVAKTAAAPVANPDSILGKVNDVTIKELLNILNTPLPKALTREEAAAAVDDRAQKALKAAGLPEKLGEEQMKRFIEQGKQAEADKNKDLWLSAAIGAFGMAAGGSPYALKNIAEGFGLGTKQAMSVLKDFRTAENERQKGMFEVERAQRLEVLGHTKESEESYQKSQESHDRARDHRMAAVSTLTGKLAASEQTAATRAVGMAQAQAARETAQATREAEIERRKEDSRARRQQELSALVIRRLNELQNNPAYANNPEEARRQAIKDVASIVPDYAESMGLKGGSNAPSIDLSKWGNTSVVGGR